MEEPIAMLRGVIKRMQTIESVGSRFYAICTILALPPFTPLSPSVALPPLRDFFLISS
jgi:hypothetical protein